MNYHFDIDVKPVDFFKLSMRKTYKSPVGICNIVFTLAAIALTVRFFGEAADWVRLLLILMCILFPVIQPISVYFRGRALAVSIPKGLTLDVNDSGIVASLNSQSEKIEWKRVKALIDNNSMLVLVVDGKNGYFLTDRVLKDKREEFIGYAEARLGKG